MSSWFSSIYCERANVYSIQDGAKYTIPRPDDGCNCTHSRLKFKHHHRRPHPLQLSAVAVDRAPTITAKQSWFLMTSLHLPRRRQQSGNVAATMTGRTVPNDNLRAVRAAPGQDQVWGQARVRVQVRTRLSLLMIKFNWAGGILNSWAFLSA
ncbi:hypothetical protein AG1IA_03097 [Rhizoctonia solani AG-1 IA]|uniref:Uncharacterized protein n=1 Tax=Thanatephorus cucumeris (strain AG1-IA) TaxID=983506 RepID=L8WY09_THACA|nr:hypothetical protein AG1IA_03097 [Rhizoctonia solani AG-1 IA]